MSFSTPVAFLIFNRPDLTQRVFEAIAKAKPKQLFVVADGPRFPEEEEKCDRARAVINGVGWDCEVFTNYSDKNLGCGRRIASGIDWVFSKVEEAIFLEDDCLPVVFFFPFCRELLERYRYDERIMTINGNNFQSDQSRTLYSYHFSKYNGCWGWASWRRAWKHYDYEMKTWPEFKQAGMLEMICENPYEQKLWTKLFDSMYETPGKIDTWDHQWKYACWVNLVSNLGLNRSDATHTTGKNPLLEQISKTQKMGEIQHPPFVVRHRDADAYIFEYIAGGKEMRRNETLIGKLYKRLADNYDKLRKLF
jgi:hypothetical protein